MSFCSCVVKGELVTVDDLTHCSISSYACKLLAWLEQYLSNRVSTLLSDLSGAYGDSTGKRGVMQPKCP